MLKKKKNRLEQYQFVDVVVFVIFHVLAVSKIRFVPEVEIVRE